MFLKLGLSFACCLLLAAEDCSSKRDGAKAVPSPVAAAETPAVPSQAGDDGGHASARDAGACSLIESAEVAALQGEQVRAAQPSSSTGNGFAVTQCYYTVYSADGSKNLSVHLEVTRNDPAGTDREALARLWQQRFREARDKKKSDKPRPVQGVGEEAYWVGNEKIGALYALQGEQMVRVSVGGPEGETSKIEKSKTLAAKALSRLK